MSCEEQSFKKTSDNAEGNEGLRLFDDSHIAWLIGQAVRYLNTSDKEGELSYLRACEVLRHFPKEVNETVIQIFKNVHSGDAPLRWCLLYVLGDTGDESAVDFLVSSALKKLPEAKEDQGCEGHRDMELLVCTMAVHALQYISKRHPQISDSLLKIIHEKPVRPILIEAVKIASELGLKEKIAGLLQKEDLWILDIRKARTEELFAKPEREDVKERGYTPPYAELLKTTPKIQCSKERRNL